jgi:APA family basic amino acid/polyamine antiporter
MFPVVPLASGEYVYLREAFGRPMAFLPGRIFLIVGFSAPIAIGLLSVISAMILAGPRVYYAMARDGAFVDGLARLKGRHQTPVYSIILQGLLAIAMVLSASFDKLLIYIGFTLSLFAALTVCGLLLIRKRNNAPVADYRTWGYPVTPLVFIAGNLWIIYYSIMIKPLVSAVGLITIGIGILVYLLIKRLHAKENKGRS